MRAICMGAISRLVCGVMLTLSATAQAQCVDWPAYRAFVTTFVQDDGRVIDLSTQQTTSEGQAYGMFFALVANDRPRFDKMLQWTRKNLSAGRFDTRSVTLPAWQWGRQANGAYGVLDRNSASDADLWIAYNLLQAGKLWRETSYTQLAYALAAQIAAQEIVDLTGLGPMLLPGKEGFQKGGVTRLNPSYLPLPVLRAFAIGISGGPWARLPDNAFRLIAQSASHGFSPDWAAYQSENENGHFIVDPLKGDVGSYDAIRVYLWAGLSSPADPLSKRWLAALGGMRTRITETGTPPERVDTLTGHAQGEAPLGFWGALLPYLNALGDTRGAGLARVHLAGALTDRSTYYDYVLILFGMGAAEGRYRFDETGQLTPRWETSCESATARAS